MTDYLLELEYDLLLLVLVSLSLPPSSRDLEGLSQRTFRNAYDDGSPQYVNCYLKSDVEKRYCTYTGGFSQF